ncbi:MAG: sensor histidine kinase [Gaiellaceae bacterium]
MSSFMRSIRVRLTLLYSGVLFAVAALLVAGLYVGLSLSLRDEPVSQGAAIVATVPVNDGSAVEERTFVDAQAFEHQVNERTLRNLRSFSLAALAALFVASLAVGWVIAGRVLAPIAHITEVAREIQARELSRRIELDGPDDELKRLADTFDSMLARLDVAFDSQRRFVADASHELRTPLAIIKANLELALTDASGTPESRASAAAVIERAIERMARLTDDLLALARLDAPTAAREPVLVHDLLADAGEEFAAAALARGVVLEVETAAAGPVAGDRDVLKRALGNLLDNAIRVAGSSVRLSHGELDGWAWIAVADDGPGIAREHRQSVFGRFWRADDARSRPGGGSGLGLAIVRQIAEAHGGTVEVDSEPGAGATFVLRLPRATVGELIA